MFIPDLEGILSNSNLWKREERVSEVESNGIDRVINVGRNTYTYMQHLYVYKCNSNTGKSKNWVSALLLF